MEIILDSNSKILNIITKNAVMFYKTQVTIFHIVYYTHLIYDNILVNMGFEYSEATS